jgi:uncharacterized protein (TIGR01244 family)
MAEPMSGWEGVSNVTREGEYTFAGQPTEAAIERFAAEGGAMVIDLRGHQGRDTPPFDERAKVEAAGLSYVHIPMSPATFSGGDVEAFARAVDEAGGPVLIHCGTSNRVGGMWAAYVARKRGVPMEKAIEAGKAAGMRSEDVEQAARRVIGG